MACCLTGSLLLLGGFSCAASDVQRLPTGPAAGDMELSGFYRWPGPMPTQPGVPLRDEALPEASQLSAAGESIRLLYTSTDARWQSGLIPVSGTLFLPAGTPPENGWPLLAWGHGTLGIADICAPSWTGHRARDAAYLDNWLKAGFAVVATDYQGLGGPGPHPYLYWQAEGRSILDSVRAALAARPGAISNHIIIAGQSQGGGAALGAAALAREYAPELNVLGAVATGPNSTYPDGPVSVPVRNSSNMFLSIISGGLRDDAPPVETFLNEKGMRLLESARMACTREIGLLANELGVSELGDAFAISLEELAPMRIPVTDRPMQAVDMPYMIATGMADDTVEPFRQHAVVAALCAAENSVIWARYEGLDHDETLNGSFADSLGFAWTLLSGAAVENSCAALPPAEHP